ncbi:preprotein translocase subunit YajC [uncultured Rhodospira sp.]|uniref:preprotein translocase subunit YajC n=1 Tax=uncultured Rhodospira sp. TaxID=1936189 RepID=UPI00345A6595
MFISPAFAQAAAPPAGGTLDALGAFLPLILIFVIFYFLIIRPQQKRMKDHKAMLAAIRRGDRIVTNGGIVGSVVKVTNDSELLVEIADNVRVKVMREMVADVASKTEPVASGGDKGKGGKGRQATANDTDDGDDDANGGDTPPDNSGSGGSGGSASKLKGLLSKK